MRWRVLLGCYVAGCLAGCGGVYEAVAPEAQGGVKVAVWPDTFRQGSGAMDALLLLDVRQGTRLSISELSADSDLELFSLQAQTEPECAARAGEVVKPARFGGEVGAWFCVRVQLSPTAKVGEKRLRLVLRINDVLAVGETDLFVLQAVQ